MAAANDAMSALDAQWYNALTSGLGLDPAQFQLVQGSTALGSVNGNIWRIFDNMPPESVSTYFNPTQMNSLAQSYGAVLNNLIPQNGDALQRVLKNDYVAWLSFAKDPANLPTPRPSPIDVVAIRVGQMAEFGLTNGIETSVIEAATTVIRSKDIVGTALTEYLTADGDYAYTATQSTLGTALDSGKSKSVTLNSLTETSDVTHTWAKVSASGLFDIFNLGGSSSYDHLTTEMTSKGINLEVKFQTVATLTGGPYANKDTTDPGLAKNEPWYNTKLMQTAQSENDNKLWRHTAPTWDSTFGPKGNMNNIIGALIVVDGISTKMTTTAAVATSDRTEVTAKINGGIWPFFSVSGEGGWTHTTTFNDDGSFIVESSCKAGNPNVLGVLVTPFDKTIGNA